MNPDLPIKNKQKKQTNKKNPTKPKPHTKLLYFLKIMYWFGNPPSTPLVKTFNSELQSPTLLTLTELALKAQTERSPTEYLAATVQNILLGGGREEGLKSLV